MEETKTESGTPEQRLWVRSLTVGIVGTCCYLVGLQDRMDCVVIDPGDEAERIRQAAAGREIAAILLTHGHFDHIGGVSGLMGEKTRLLIHPLDEAMLHDPAKNAGMTLLRRRITAPDATDLVQEGTELNLAGMQIRVLHTPGHTPGSVCYQIGEDLFTGDTMFEHGWGRTDLPGGSQHDMFASLRRLIPMAQGLKIHPGHDD